MWPYLTCISSKDSLKSKVPLCSDESKAFSKSPKSNRAITIYNTIKFLAKILQKVPTKA